MSALTVTELYAHAAAGDVAVLGGMRDTSAKAILEASARVAAGLRDMGIGKGDRVAAWLPNLEGYLVLHTACARLGAIMVAINTRFGATDVVDIIQRSGAKALAAGRNVDLLANADDTRMTALAHLIIVDEPESRPIFRRVSSISFATLAQTAPLDIDNGGPSDPVNIFTTSGTTSAPKFAMHTQGAITGHAFDVATFLDLTAPGSVNLQLLPFCGVFGFVQVMAALAGQANLVMPVDFDVAHALTLGADHGATHMFVTDDMLHRMLEATTAAQPFPKLKSCMYAGFNTWLHDLPARAEAHGVPVQGAYGMSEVFAIFAGRPIDGSQEERHLPGGTMVSPGAQVRARDPVSGELLAHGQAGELEIKGPFMMAGYFGDDKATRAAYTEDGYLRTGDLGHTAPDHSFVYLQRMNDTLRLGGFLVAPSEIESVVMAHPTVRDAQVVAAGTRAGNRPVAFVIPADRENFKEADVIEHCRAALPRFKCPVRVIHMDAFPVTPGANGTKIQRAKLRELAEAELKDGRPINTSS